MLQNFLIEKKDFLGGPGDAEATLKKVNRSPQSAEASIHLQTIKETSFPKRG